MRKEGMSKGEEIGEEREVKEERRGRGRGRKKVR